MRYLLVSLLWVATLFAFSSNSMAVGVYTPGKEPINCSSLVKRGVIPDTWNKLTEALLIPQICWAIDKVAIEAKAVIAQFGQPPTSENSEVAPAKETKEIKDESSSLAKGKIKKLSNTKKKQAASSSKISLKKKKKTETKKAKPAAKKRIKAPLKAL